MKTKKELLKQLEILSVKANDEFIEIVLPVYLRMNSDNNALILKIKPTEGGFMITDTGNHFNEFNNDASYYYDLFVKNNGNDYKIRLYNEILYKSYPDNFSVICAIDEFVRFFIKLDDFISENNLF
mgnify:CR=1 FL=1